MAYNARIADDGLTVAIERTVTMSPRGNQSAWWVDAVYSLTPREIEQVRAARAVMARPDREPNIAGNAACVESARRHDEYDRAGARSRLSSVEMSYLHAYKRGWTPADARDGRPRPVW